MIETSTPNDQDLDSVLNAPTIVYFQHLPTKRIIKVWQYEEGYHTCEGVVVSPFELTRSHWIPVSDRFVNIREISQVLAMFFVMAASFSIGVWFGHVTASELQYNDQNAPVNP